MTHNKFEVMLLKKLLGRDKWGASYTHEDNILRCLKHLPKKDKKLAQTSYSKLIKKRLSDSLKMNLS